MAKGIDNHREERILQQTLNNLSAKSRAPLSVYFVLLALYFIATIIVSRSAGSDATISMGGQHIPVFLFAGVFSSLSNICVILLTVYCGKLGFITSLMVIVMNIPMVMIGIIMKHNMNSIPGVFGNLLAIVAITVVFVNNVKIERIQEKLRKQALTDILTGLPNWYACARLVDEIEKSGEKFATASIDLNGFKSINETMGFEMGNKVLKKVASLWREIAETGASGTRDFIIRLNGDEFALVIRDFDSDEDVLNTIKMYESAISKKLSIDGYDFYISASFGYAEYPKDNNDVQTVMLYANEAMREIKKASSSNHILRFSKDIIREERILEVESKIRSALENDTVFFNLQPQYDMNRKLRGFEALARMKDADGSIISPGEFIPVAEKVGLVDKIDSAVFRKATGFVGELISRTGADITLSLNVSVRHLMKSDFLDEIKNLVKNSGIPAEQIEIEITESVMIDSVEKALQYIDELKTIGVKIAIDDFGTGYSSLSYLSSFPANLLKIDKSFIDKMNSSESSKQYVEAIISLGHILGFDVISEGVEEQDQLDTLNAIGCDYIQGFIWGRPLPPEEAGKLVLGE